MYYVNRKVHVVLVYVIKMMPGNTGSEKKKKKTQPELFIYNQIE